jgi:hypothetical protein
VPDGSSAEHDAPDRDGARRHGHAVGARRHVRRSQRIDRRYEPYLVDRDIAARYNRSLADNARMFAMVVLAGADTAITVWNDKAKYSFWRPITAIQEADTDGNPQTVADPKWLPLINTPPYPDMPSGLSSLSGAEARALQDFFGTDRLAFGTTNSIGITRNYASFSQAKDEVVNARVWSGIHFRHAGEVGAAIGKRVAFWQQFFFPRPAHHRHHR